MKIYRYKIRFTKYELNSLKLNDLSFEKPIYSKGKNKATVLVSSATPISN